MILLETKWLAHGRHFIKSVCFVVFFLVLVQGSQSVMASSLFKKPQAKGKHFALIIGHNGGSRFLKPLLFAKQDAKRMSKLLVELGGYKKNEVKLLLSPDLKQIQKTMKQLKQLYKGQEKKGSFFFYYSGHARPGYFQLGEELLAFKKMVHFVKSLPVKLRFIIIDSCYSGSVLGVGSKGLKWANSIGWKKRRFQKKIKGFVILTSSGANSRSFESKRLRSSFFTSSLLAGLRGAADSDNDKRISLSELRRYVYQQTLAHSTRHKTPFQRPSSRIDIRGGQHIYLTYLQQAHSRMTLRQNFQGHVFLFREGKLVHEFKKEQNKITTIAVNPGSY